LRSRRRLWRCRSSRRFVRLTVPLPLGGDRTANGRSQRTVLLCPLQTVEAQRTLCAGSQSGFRDVRGVIQITSVTCDAWIRFVPSNHRRSSLQRRKSGAPMRKNTSFAIAAAMLGLAITVWVKSSVDATGADGIRPKVGLTTYSIASNSYLPIRGIEPGW
jgi:hypothetical protein